MYDCDAFTGALHALKHICLCVWLKQTLSTGGVCVCWLYWYSYTYEDICLGKTHCCGDSCPSGDVYIAPPLERRCFRVQTVFEVRFRISLRLELRLGVGVGIHL